MKIYFDEKGRIRPPTIPDGSITQGDHNAIKIEAYADFDVSPYFVSITLQRADGVVLGPYAMTPIASLGGGLVAYHEYYLQSTDTAVAGALGMTIRYEVYQQDPDTSELVPTYSKATGKIVANIGQAVTGGDNVILNIQYRISQLEKDVMDLEAAEGRYDQITVSTEEPVNKPTNHIWFKIE
ncbi:MAG TPA: hypothetical protein PLR16_05040 [Bacilli bacterium]|nr:MAG: hypothetical protein BWY97_00088 [Tenericutes bacterium ADurb.BinA124]HPX84625.1 hypothetical protein [Bacilli bacterium]